MKINEIITEGWSQKYKQSIDCSHPRGFSQQAHCAGKKKHNESADDVMEIKKGQRDSNGYTRCWPGHHAEGTKPGKNGGRVRNCVPNESISEDFEDDERFDIIEEMVEDWAAHHGVDSDVIWEDLDRVDDEELLSEAEAWQTKKGKNKNCGLNKKGVATIFQ